MRTYPRINPRRTAMPNVRPNSLDLLPRGVLCARHNAGEVPTAPPSQGGSVIPILWTLTDFQGAANNVNDLPPAQSLINCNWPVRPLSFDVLGSTTP